MKKIGEFNPQGDVTKSSIVIEINTSGIVFIQQDDQSLVFHKDDVPNMLDLLERIIMRKAIDVVRQHELMETPELVAPRETGEFAEYPNKAKAGASTNQTLIDKLDCLLTLDPLGNGERFVSLDQVKATIMGDGPATGDGKPQEDALGSSSSTMAGGGKDLKPLPASNDILIEKLEELVGEAYQLAGWAFADILEKPFPEENKRKLLDLLAYDIQEGLDKLRPSEIPVNEIQSAIEFALINAEPFTVEEVIRVAVAKFTGALPLDKLPERESINEKPTITLKCISFPKEAYLELINQGYKVIHLPPDGYTGPLTQIEDGKSHG